MKIGILKADSVLAEFQPEFGDYPDMFIARLSANADPEVTFVTYDIEHFEYPTALDDCDGYIITGSKKSVYDDEPWIHRLEEYVRELDQARKPLVGVCFGHQMVAQALGGKTESAAVGWGVGVHTTKMVVHKPFMQPPLEQVRVLVSHKDQVTALPPGATQLATSEFCPNAMFEVGEHTFCVQGHPEFIKPYSKSLITMRREILGETVFQRGIDSLSEPLDSDTLAKWILRFFEMRS